MTTTEVVKTNHPHSPHNLWCWFVKTAIHFYCELPDIQDRTDVGFGPVKASLLWWQMWSHQKRDEKNKQKKHKNNSWNKNGWSEIKFLFIYFILYNTANIFVPFLSSSSILSPSAFLPLPGWPSAGRSHLMIQVVLNVFSLRKGSFSSSLFGLKVFLLLGKVPLCDFNLITDFSVF